MKELSFSTDITASPEAIWQVLWSDKTFRDWANYIDEGMYLKGEVPAGNVVTFVGSAGSAQVQSLVKVCKPYQQVTFWHKSEAEYGGEWAGGSESYILAAQGDTTKLTLTLDVPAEHQAGFKAQIPKALARIKELTEAASTVLS